MQVWTDWAANGVGGLLAAGLAVAVLAGVLLFVRRRRGDSGRKALSNKSLTRDVALSRLNEALEAMTDGLAYYDAEDRLMVWNAQYKRTNPEIADNLERGITFEQILRLGLDKGHYVEAIGREEEWLAERLSARRFPTDAG